MQQESIKKTVVTLGHLRADTSLSGRQVRDLMVAHDPQAPKNVSSIAKLEAKGTDDLKTLRAYAHALGVPLSKVLDANENTKNGAERFEFRRGRKKKSSEIMN